MRIYYVASYIDGCGIQYSAADREIVNDYEINYMLYKIMCFILAYNYADDVVAGSTVPGNAIATFICGAVFSFIMHVALFINWSVYCFNMYNISN